MNGPKPTLDQAIALYRLTAQLRGIEWTDETFDDEDVDVEASLANIAETADQIWEYLVKKYG
jgi:hypothetical protein